MDFDVIVLGSGAAGTFATLGLQNCKVLVLDYGNTYSNQIPKFENLYESKKKSDDFFLHLIGKEFESLHNIFHKEITPKTKAPHLRYVIKGSKEYLQNTSPEFTPTTSLAKGGLANVWGAQVYRFDNKDLKDFPFSYDELASHYDKVAEEIGISGSDDDDLASFHGTEPILYPALSSSELGKSLLNGYYKNKKDINKNGIYIGKPRLAVLTQPHKGRVPLDYSNLEFFIPGNSAYYSPAFTLDQLIKKNSIAYKSGYLAERFDEDSIGVTVYAKNIKTGQNEIFKAKKILIGLGCIHTAKFLLNSKNDFETRLPILENPMSFTPLVNPFFLGSVQQKLSYSSELTLFYNGQDANDTVIAMIYNLDGLLRADTLFDFPFNVKNNIKAAKYMMPCMMAMQVYYSQGYDSKNYMKINPDGTTSFSYVTCNNKKVEMLLIKKLMKLGFLSHTALTKISEAGTSIHYAGQCPMRENPSKKYETDANGKLFDHEHTYVIDSANFPFLPAKNLTYTIMANALRIGTHVNKQFL